MNYSKNLMAKFESLELYITNNILDCLPFGINQTKRTQL